MPAPMMTPMPKTVRSRALKVLFSLWSASSADAIDASIDLVRNTLMLTSESSGDGLITTSERGNATACECCPGVVGRAPRTGARDYPLGTHPRGMAVKHRRIGSPAGQAPRSRRSIVAQILGLRRNRAGVRAAPATPEVVALVDGLRLIRRPVDRHGAGVRVEP